MRPYKFKLCAGLVFDNVGKDTDIYPSVGLRHAGEAVRVNFGHDPFKYDIEYHVQQQRNQTWAKILTTRLKPGALGLETREGVDSSTDESEESLKTPINKLVLEYLAHYGYAKTARAFEGQCERRGMLVEGKSAAVAPPVSIPAPIPVPAPAQLPLPILPPTLQPDDHDMDMDGVPSTVLPDPPAEIEGDIELRTRIVNAVVAGDIDTALSETKKHHAVVLEEEDGLMLFKLRCRKFVELILEASELKKRMRREEVDMAVEEEDEEGLESSDGVADMEVDDDASPTTNGYSNGTAAIPIRTKRKQSVSSLSASGWTPGATTAQYENALNKAITYGQTLQTDYKTDGRPEVQAIFKRTFGIVAYVDPMDAGEEVAEIVGEEARVKLANEMNQAILSM
jgi:Ran-binding protein 9/10